MKEKIHSGFLKVASIIDANENYDYILGERLNNKKYQSISDNLGLIAAEDAYLFLKGALLKKPFQKKIIERKGRILAFGTTKNNKREFDYLDSKAELYGFSERINNIGDCRSEPTLPKNEALKERILEAFKDFLIGREKVNKSIIHQSVSYSISLLSAYETLKDLEFDTFIVSNDHSPIPVAYSKIAECMGAKTVYIQHAEVTTSFPKLDFDISILRNKVSVDIYKEKGMRGIHCYLNRSERKISKKELIEKRKKATHKDRINIVIYPSSVYSEHALYDLVEKLNSNTSVNSISIKLHPSSTTPKSFDSRNIKIINNIPSEPHISICGNSSVAIELLEKGNIVFNFFNLDNITKDYYDFVRKNITTELHLEDLSSEFWVDLDHLKSINPLNDYLPSIENNENLLESYREKEIISRVYSADINEKIKESFFERDLFLFYNSLLSLLKANKKTPYDSFWIIKNLNRLFDERDIRLSKTYKSANLHACSSALEFWVNTKVMEWNGLIPSADQIDNLVNFVQESKLDRKTKGWCEMKLFDILVRFSQPDKLAKFLEKSKIIDIYKFGTNKKISFLKYQNSHKEYGESLRTHYSLKQDENLTRLDKLKIFVQAGVRASELPPINSFKDIEAEFIHSHPKLKDEYQNLVLKNYQKISERACLIDIKHNKSQQDRFINVIKTHLLNGKGFSFIRLSDGEGFIFQNLSTHFTTKDSYNRQRHWWGEEIEKNIIDDLRLELIDAVKNSDIIGIPSIYRFVRDHADKTHSLLQSLQGRGLISVLEGIGTIDTPDKIYTDDKANIAVLNKISVIEELAAISQKIIIVNSGSSESVKSAFGSKFDFIHIQVPTHNKTNLNKKYKSSNKPLPYVYKEISKEISKNSGPGSLVLVGAGVAGKVFMDSAKKKGAVALDLGSAMDEFLNGGIHSLF